MVGRKPNLKMIHKVEAYKKKGLSNMEIARMLGKDEKQVRRWVRASRTLSTG